MSNRRGTTDSYNSPDPSDLNDEASTQSFISNLSGIGNQQVDQQQSFISDLSGIGNQQVDQQQSFISELSGIGNQQVDQQPPDNMSTSSRSTVVHNHQQPPADNTVSTSSTSTVTSISNDAPYYIPPHLMNMMMDGNNTSNHNQPTTMLTNQTIPSVQQPNPTNFVTYTIGNGSITFNESFAITVPFVIYSSNTPQNNYFVVNANTYPIQSETRTVDGDVLRGSRVIILEDPNYYLIQHYYQDRYREIIISYELVFSNNALNDLIQIVNGLQNFRYQNLHNSPP